MDPKACIKRILDAMGEEDWSEVDDAMEDLYQWLRGGGFAPVVLTLGDKPDGSPRTWIGSKGELVLEAIDHSDLTKGFHFAQVAYDDGRILKSWAFPKA